jgi:hypothetical protein
MVKLGNLIDVDIVLLDSGSVNVSNSLLVDYKLYLTSNEFKSFKIGIPFIHKNKLTDFVTQFIESTELKGSYFFYFDVKRDTKLLKLIENNQFDPNDKKVYLLPDKNLKYIEFSSYFWDLTNMGYEINILKCDSMIECQTTPKIINKYLLKGARIGITGSNKHSFGLLHKRRITKLFKENLIDYWITETIDQNDSSYLQEINLKLDLLGR